MPLSSNLRPKRSATPSPRDPSNALTEPASRRRSLIERVEESSPANAQEMAAARLAVDLVGLLQRVMSELEVSQATLARRLGVGQSAVSQVVNSDGNVRVATIGRYFRALGYQPRLFLDPVEHGRKVVASRATCVAIQTEFAQLVHTVLNSSVEYWDTASVDIQVTVGDKSYAVDVKTFAPPTDWIDVPLSFEPIAPTRDLDEERSRS